MAEIIGKQFKCNDGEWCYFINGQHYENVIKDNPLIEVRVIYAVDGEMSLVDENINLKRNLQVTQDFLKMADQEIEGLEDHVATLSDMVYHLEQSLDHYTGE